MSRIRSNPDSAAVTLASGAASAALINPPAAGGPIAQVPPEWASGTAVVSEFDLSLWTDTAAVAMTGAVLIGALPRAQILADDNVDLVDFANDELDVASHAYQNADGPVQLTTTGTLPGGLSLVTDYWVINVNSGSIKLATSRANALAGVFVSLADVGSGTHTISDTATTQRLRWAQFGKLGDSHNGAVDLTSSSAYIVRVQHNPRCVAYSIDATLDTGDVSAEIEPIEAV